MAYESVGFFQHFTELTGQDCGYHRTGCLSLATAEDGAALHDNVAMQRGVGIDVREVSAPDALAIEPHLYLDGSERIAYEADAGYADPTLTAAGMVGWARDHGVELQLNTGILDILVEHG